MDMGFKNRATRATNMNAESSRSHSIFSIYIDSQEQDDKGNEKYKASKLNLVDLAGLSAILTANRLWKDYGSFVLTGAVNPSVKKLIEISRLESILTIIPTVAESVDYVFMEDIEKELTADGDE